MDNSAKTAILKKRKAWKNLEHARTRDNHTKYRSARNKCTNTIRNSKYSYERKVATESKTNPKSFWKYANSKLKTKSCIGNLENAEGNLMYEDKEKVEILNDYFSSVFTRTEDLNEHIATREMESLLTNIAVTSEDVL